MRHISLRELIITALLLAALLVLVGFIFTNNPNEGEQEVETAAMMMDEIPPYTPEIAAMLENSAGFSALVSYTDSGFEPMNASIKQGETIRFTNNSSSELWVASDGSGENQVYPGPGECGQSALDTCRALAPQGFWEFTFDRAGTWQITNNLNKEDTTTITVTAQ